MSNLSFPRAWDGVEWQTFALRLVSLKHGFSNVQPVPDQVDGDAGLEFFTTDGCLYQCYAPKEVVDVGKAASGMKRKATADIQKLSKYEHKIQGIVGPLKFDRWILFCPFFEDKDVLRHIQKKISEENIDQLGFCNTPFVGLGKSIEDFSDEYSLLRAKGKGLPLKLKVATEKDLGDAPQGNELFDRVMEKLERGYPDATKEVLTSKAKHWILSSITKQNAAEDLQTDYPDQWDTWFTTVSMEEQRLALMGDQTGTANEFLNNELKGLQETLKEALPDLSPAFRSALAQGQLGTWLLDCPLDFLEQ
ncbi:hypothetical protein Sulfitobl28_09680 [Sulfitobacter pontiacus]|nr:hypothetical protein Sulfitobl28_09680 [Sulfitobacter pontiacus]